MEKKRQSENTNSVSQREPILKCPKCGLPFFGSKKTKSGYKVIIQKVWFKIPRFYNFPVDAEFDLECSCGKISHVKLQHPASISFLMNYLRRIFYRLQKREVMKLRKSRIKKPLRR